MYVIGHDNPGAQVITLAVESQQVLLDQRGDVWMAQMAVAGARIKVVFQDITGLDRG